MSQITSTRRRSPPLWAILFGKPETRRPVGSCHCRGPVPAHILEMRPHAADGPPHCPGCGCGLFSMPPHVHDWPKLRWHEEPTVVVERIVEHGERRVNEGRVVSHRLDAPEPPAALTTGRRVIDPFGIGD